MVSKKELQIFLFSWIQTFKRSFLVFIKYFWWLIALELILTSYTTIMPKIQIITIATSVISYYLYLLSIRASVETKTLRYFLVNLKNITVFIPLTIALALALALLAFPIMMLFPMYQVAATIIFFSLFMLLVYPVVLIAVFFFLDSAPKTTWLRRVLKASSNSFKGTTANFPIVLLISSLIIASTQLSTLLLTTLLSTFPRTLTIAITIDMILINFSSICAFSILYLKMKHENPQLFHKKNS